MSFDPTNSRSATDAYVRLAVAFDYAGAAPDPRRAQGRRRRGDERPRLGGRGARPLPVAEPGPGRAEPAPEGGSDLAGSSGGRRLEGLRPPLVDRAGRTGIAVARMQRDEVVSGNEPREGPLLATAAERPARHRLGEDGSRLSPPDLASDEAKDRESRA